MQNLINKSGSLDYIERAKQLPCQREIYEIENGGCYLILWEIININVESEYFNYRLIRVSEPPSMLIHY